MSVFFFNSLSPRPARQEFSKNYCQVKSDRRAVEQERNFVNSIFPAKKRLGVTELNKIPFQGQ